MSKDPDQLIEYMQTGQMNKHRAEMGLKIYCPVCGEQLTNNNAQYSHHFSQGKLSRKKHGDKIIDHPLNGCYTCSLECNGAVAIDHNDYAQTYLKDKIMNALLQGE